LSDLLTALNALLALQQLKLLMMMVSLDYEL